jgi:hypothetical protein
MEENNSNQRWCFTSEVTEDDFYAPITKIIGAEYAKDSGSRIAYYRYLAFKRDGYLYILEYRPVFTAVLGTVKRVSY